MKTFTISLKWSEQNQKWLMFLGNFFVHDYWPCKTIYNAFMGPDKIKDTFYKITIEKINNKVE